MSPGHEDAAVVRRHLAALDRALRHLRRHSGGTLEVLLAGQDQLWSVERGLQIAAQNAIDIATHLVAASGGDAPDYASAIDELARMKVLPPEFAMRFRAVAGFRNLLVHAYLEIDYRQLHRFLNERLGDFTEFAGHIERHLAAAGTDSDES